MQSFQDKNGNIYILYPDVRNHILSSHPEMSKYLEDIEITLKKPNAIYRSERFNQRGLYYRHFKGDLYFVVVVDMEQRIIKTAFITDRIKKGELIWQEKK